MEARCGIITVCRKWSETDKILCDFLIQVDQVLEHNTPDLVVIDKVHHICFIVDLAYPFDLQIIKKESDKIDRLLLSTRYSWLWKTKKVKTVSIIVMSLGTVSEDIKGNIKVIGIEFSVELLQKFCFLDTAKIIRTVLDS